MARKFNRFQKIWQKSGFLAKTCLKINFRGKLTTFGHITMLLREFFILTPKRFDEVDFFDFFFRKFLKFFAMAISRASDNFLE